MAQRYRARSVTLLICPVEAARSRGYWPHAFHREPRGCRPALAGAVAVELGAGDRCDDPRSAAVRVVPAVQHRRHPHGVRGSGDQHCGGAVPVRDLARVLRPAGRLVRAVGHPRPVGPAAAPRIAGAVGHRRTAPRGAGVAVHRRAHPPVPGLVHALRHPRDVPLPGVQRRDPRDAVVLRAADRVVGPRVVAAGPLGGALVPALRPRTRWNGSRRLWARWPHAARSSAGRSLPHSPPARCSADRCSRCRSRRWWLRHWPVSWSPWSGTPRRARCARTAPRLYRPRWGRMRV